MISKVKESRDSNYIYKSKLDKVCFTHDATYASMKDLGKRTLLDKFLKYCLWNFTKFLTWWLSKRIDKYGKYVFWSENGSVVRESVLVLLAQEFQKPVIKEKRVYSRYKYNIWPTYLAEMESYESRC